MLGGGEERVEKAGSLAYEHLQREATVLLISKSLPGARWGGGGAEAARTLVHSFVFFFLKQITYCIFMAGGRKSVRTVSNEVRYLSDE